MFFSDGRPLEHRGVNMTCKPNLPILVVSLVKGKEQTSGSITWGANE